MVLQLQAGATLRSFLFPHFLYNTFMTLDQIPHHLPINLETFGFVEREKDSVGRTVKNRCGRDFFYYALHYYDPTAFSPSTLCPTKIERRGIFGIPMPAALVWTGLSFRHIPRLFKERGLTLRINSLAIFSYWNFMRGMLFKKPAPFEQEIAEIQKAIDNGNVVGIDVAIKFGGLIDHVMFVYGYDNENLYVLDTRKVPWLSYEKITPDRDKRFIMKLPFSTIKKNWTRWNRAWIISSPTSLSSLGAANR